jgi:heme/copper-type cytochrome/quinol oxidase subunit 4
MALIGLVLLALVIIFFIIFSTPQARQGEAFHLISGFMEGLIINFLLIILLILLASLLSSAPGFLTHIPIYGIAGMGVLQLLYVVPRSLYLRRHQRWAKLKGIIAAFVIVALLNGGCWVMLGGIGSG